MRILDRALALAMLIVLMSLASGCGETHCEITCLDGYTQTGEGECSTTEIIQLSAMHVECFGDNIVEDDF